jgi:hypothetical protein
MLNELGVLCRVLTTGDDPVAVGTGAAAAPAIRSIRVDPASTLRQE